MEGREKGKFRMEAANMQKCTLGPMYNVHVQVHYMYLCMYVCILSNYVYMYMFALHKL